MNPEKSENSGWNMLNGTRIEFQPEDLMIEEPFIKRLRNKYEGRNLDFEYLDEVTPISSEVYNWLNQPKCSSGKWIDGLCDEIHNLLVEAESNNIEI